MTSYETTQSVVAVSIPPVLYSPSDLISEYLSVYWIVISCLRKGTFPVLKNIFPPTVQSMKQRGGSATIEELEEDVAKLPERLLAIPHKNGSELAWVRTYLKKAGLAENSARAVWSLTDQGEAIPDNSQESQIVTED